MMAFKAQKDTYAFERVGPDTVVRREIRAGHPVPPGLFADEEGNTPLDLEEDQGSNLGAGAAPYPHQLDAQGNLRDEHKVKVKAYEPPVDDDEVETGQEQTATEDVEKRVPQPPEGKLPQPASEQPSQQATVQKKK
jgi:hypothetical protein